MAELFKLKLESHRIVIPERLRSRLQLVEGKEFNLGVNQEHVVYLGYPDPQGAVSGSIGTEWFTFKLESSRITLSELFCGKLQLVEGREFDFTIEDDGSIRIGNPDHQEIISDLSAAEDAEHRRRARKRVGQDKLNRLMAAMRDRHNVTTRKTASSV